MNPTTAEEQAKHAGPLVLTIFGITGDLSHRMLLPALYDLASQDLLPPQLIIMGITRRPYAVEQLLASVEKNMKEKGETCDPEILKRLGERIELTAMDLSDDSAYTELRSRLDAIEEEQGICMHRMFYLAIPASLFDEVVEQLGKNGLNYNCPHGTGESRLLMEKPFGHDLASAEELIKRVRTHFEEKQIYRIDHFLAKETAQNILTFRSQNALFLDVWSKRCISHIAISATETIDIEGRANFYEQTGALRDMIQSHVLQLLTLTTMDVPDKPTTGAIHESRANLLQAIKPASPDQAVRGQYAGYRDEVDNHESTTETYAALQLEIDTDTWRGVPIFLRTGKALSQKLTTITVIFTDTRRPDFDNALTFHLGLGASEGISLHMRAKKPGFDDATQDVTMDFCYSSSFHGERQPTAYERVLLDAFRGDQTLFATSDEVLASWQAIEPLLDTWAKNDKGLQTYSKGSDGPEAAKELATREGLAWPADALTACAIRVTDTDNQKKG